ncbi:MAG TPA: sporulation inhibitor of replication protein SirA [Bacillota bacterium]|nr:sporulation inhibitor of replication protein SirA [Bacillota bacterium]
MKKYKLYWIQKEVANYFYHKGDILYRFLLEYLQSKSYHTIIQYDYITKEMPHSDLIMYIKEKCKLHNIEVIQKEQTIQLQQKETIINVMINDTNIEIFSRTIHCAEKVIFPILRTFEPSLFIVGEAKNEYGWIAPFRHEERFKTNEKLYSMY